MVLQEPETNLLHSILRIIMNLRLLNVNFRHLRLDFRGRQSGFFLDEGAETRGTVESEFVGNFFMRLIASSQHSLCFQ